MSSGAGHCKNKSACSTSSSTTSGWSSKCRENIQIDAPVALEFLLQTLAPLDVATRGFLDGTRRYAEQRARAEDLADRDKFRTALVNSLQEGFFVADHEGAVIEMNNAFIEILGYPPEGLPYRWPHPWLVDKKTARAEQSRVRSDGSAQYETPIRHRDGHLAWVTVSINAVSGSRHRPRRLRRNDSRHHRGTGICRPGERGAAPGHRGGGGQKRGRGAGDHPRRVPDGDRRAARGRGHLAGRRRRTDRPGGGRARRIDVARTRSVVAQDLSGRAPPAAADGQDGRTAGPVPARHRDWSRCSPARETSRCGWSFARRAGSARRIGCWSRC